jgi:hypothetical protein
MLSPTAINYKRYQFKAWTDPKDVFCEIGDIYDSLTDTLLSSTGEIQQVEYNILVDSVAVFVGLNIMATNMSEDFQAYTWEIAEYINR